MTFKQIDHSNYIILNTLKLGDCFLYDGRVGMVASRNGHDFYLDLATGHEFWGTIPNREWIPHSTPAMISGLAEVQKVHGEFVYEIY